MLCNGKRWNLLGSDAADYEVLHPRHLCQVWSVSCLEQVDGLYSIDLNDCCDQMSSIVYVW
jgi:hypothetical protein